MSIARHHAEWLSLVEVSGPFLSMPVLLEAFRDGLEAHDPDHHRILRLAHDDGFVIALLAEHAQRDLYRAAHESERSRQLVAAPVNGVDDGVFVRNAGAVANR